MSAVDEDSVSDLGLYRKMPFSIDKSSGGAFRCRFKGCGTLLRDFNDAENHAMDHIRSNQEEVKGKPSNIGVKDDLELLRSDVMRYENLSAKSDVLTMKSILAQSTGEALKAYIPSLGKSILFKPVTVADYIEYSLITDTKEADREYVFRCLNHADSTVTKEDIKALPVYILNEILVAIELKIRFLQMRHLITDLADTRS